MKHELAIDTIQDKVIYLTGQIEMLKEYEYTDLSRDRVKKEWEKQIKELKEAQEILKNSQ